MIVIPYILALCLNVGSDMLLHMSWTAHTSNTQDAKMTNVEPSDAPACVNIPCKIPSRRIEIMETTRWASLWMRTTEKFMEMWWQERIVTAIAGKYAVTHVKYQNIGTKDTVMTSGHLPPSLHV